MSTANAEIDKGILNAGEAPAGASSDRARTLKGKDWCLSPEQSLSLHAENWTVPKQLLVRATKARNNITALPHDTSLLDIRSTLPEGKDIVEKDGLRLFSLSTALIACAPGTFVQNPTDMRAAFHIRVYPSLC